MSYDTSISQIIAQHAVKLTSCSFAPLPNLLSHNLNARASPRWDAPSLGHLASLNNLTSLSVTRLSQAGARAIGTLFDKMGDGDSSALEDVSLDFLWLDDALCEALVKAGRRLRRLRLSTAGTKLSDRGVLAIIEGCDALEELWLDEVQGMFVNSHITLVINLVFRTTLSSVMVQSGRASSIPEYPSSLYRYERSRSTSLLDSRPPHITPLHCPRNSPKAFHHAHVPPIRPIFG